MDESELALVAAAFDTLLEVVNRECDYRTVEAVRAAKLDVLAILSGEWPAQADAVEVEEEDAEHWVLDVIREEVKADAAELEEEEPEPADAPRCATCNQTLWEIGRSGFACPTCYETYGAEAVAARLPF